MLRSWLVLLGALLSSGLVHAGASNSLLDVSPDGKKLLAANADNGTVTVVDLAERKAVHEIKVGDKPEGVTWIGTGPLALATVYREDVVVVLDTSKGEVVGKIKVFDEPYGIVANKAGTKAYVTLDYPGMVVEIDVASKKVAREFKVGPFARGLSFSPDEKLLYVTEFYSGILHALEVASGKVVDTWKGSTRDNLVRQVAIHPTRPKAYLPHIRSRIDVIDGNGSIFPQVTICDLVPANDKNVSTTAATRRTSVMMDSFNTAGGFFVPCNPWEIALSPDGTRLYTIYVGTDDMNICEVLNDNYREIERIGGLVRLGKNPRAIRCSPDGKNVYVYNTLDFSVSIHQANDMKLVGSVTVCPPAKTPEWVRGKFLFGTAKSPLTSRNWISCASCHPDGLTDGRIWQNPEGLRKTPALAGLAHTHPLHWSADRDEVQDFEYTIFGRLMQGRGFLGRSAVKAKLGFDPVELKEKTSERNPDLDALAIYTNSFEFQLSPHIPEPGKLSESAQRGKALFASAETKCATCHTGPYFSDSKLTQPFNVHDVGTGKDDPSEKMGPKYDTPSLLGVYRTAPYLHHGKALSLHDVLVACNKDDKHGKTSHLKKEEIDDLVDYLKSLPYEKPPDETPNTVKFRVPPKK